jgi:hypothetical protein
VVSTTVTVCVQVTVLLQASVTIQTRVRTCAHVPLLVVLSAAMEQAGLQHVVTGTGGSKIQSDPHWTVLLVGQISDRLDGG